MNTMNTESNTGHLLSGLRILDLGTMVAGPVACTLFGDFGAEVIKVEVPERGDTVRDIGPYVDDVCLYWSVENRNKKSVTLDLRTQQGRELLLKLIAHADAVVENFRPGTLEKWGLPYDVMKAHNEDLILLRISGFGQTGPYHARAGYDRIALAFGGVMGITGFPDRPPVKIGTSIADYQTAILGAFALLMAIYHRDTHDGGGQEIDLAMYESIARFTDVLIPAYDRLGTARQRRGNTHFASAPGEHFLTSDGRYIILTISANAGFERLCAVMGRQDWATDPRFVSHESRWENVDELNRGVAEWILSKPTDEICRILDEGKLAYSFIYSVADMVNDPHYQARGTITTVHDPKIGPIRMTGVVPKFSNAPEKSITPAPELGDSNEEVYAGLLGLSRDELDQLRADKVI
ncbi:Formyl-CoA transferase [Bordetella tumbae]|uniref:CaiB/BaiF CoA transferase family protein n=1 Tax=Bordetella tumbae TaxID=1649139 RepID=UPI0039F06F1D